MKTTTINNEATVRNEATINNEAITKAVTEKATEVCNDILGIDSKIPATMNVTINVAMSYGDINCDISCDVHADNAAYRNKQYNKNHSRRNRNKNNVTNNNICSSDKTASTRQDGKDFVDAMLSEALPTKKDSEVNIDKQQQLQMKESANRNVDDYIISLVERCGHYDYAHDKKDHNQIFIENYCGCGKNYDHVFNDDKFGFVFSVMLMDHGKTPLDILQILFDIEDKIFKSGYKFYACCEHGHGNIVASIVDHANHGRSKRRNETLWSFVNRVIG